MASPSTHSAGYNFQPGDTVWVIHNNSVKRGEVQWVEIDINSSNTSIIYWIKLDGEDNVRRFDESVVYATCREAPGYQDIEFKTVVAPTDPVFELPVIGTPSAVFEIDGVVFILVSTLTPSTATLQDIVDEINALLNPAATAEILTIGETTQRTVIRVTSATKGPSSTVRITDGGVVLGSPLTLEASP